MTIKNKYIFDRDGNFNVQRLLCLGFLYCFQYNYQTRIDEFWQLVNPEIEEEVPVEKIIEFLKMLIFISISFPYQFENAKEANKRNDELLSYLNSNEAQSFIDPNGEVDEILVAKLLDLENIDELKEKETMSYQEIFTSVKP